MGQVLTKRQRQHKRSKIKYGLTQTRKDKSVSTTPGNKAGISFSHCQAQLSINKLKSMKLFDLKLH